MTARTLLVAAVVYGLLDTAALAATPLDRLIAPIDGKTACFTRIYDPAHLRAHPKQKTTAVAVWLTYQMPPGATDAILGVGLSVTQRGDSVPFFAQGGCAWDAGANRDTSNRRIILELNKDEGGGCMMTTRPDVFDVQNAEEGGYLILDRGKDDNSLMVYLGGLLVMVKRADRAKQVDVSFDAEDHVFLLRRADSKVCAAIEDAVTTPESAPARR
jgi:hypothetical protein